MLRLDCENVLHKIRVLFLLSLDLSYTLKQLINHVVHAFADIALEVAVHRDLVSDASLQSNDQIVEVAEGQKDLPAVLAICQELLKDFLCLFNLVMVTLCCYI